jgi:hypothetical protein
MEGSTDRPALHFVGFRDDRYHNAVRVWGKPDFYHFTWDRRAQRDIAPGDTVIFATGDAFKEPGRFNGNDIFEELE